MYFHFTGYTKLQKIKNADVTQGSSFKNFTKALKAINRLYQDRVSFGFSLNFMYALLIEAPSHSHSIMPELLFIKNITTFHQV